MHIDETVLAPLRARYGEPLALRWEGEVSEREHAMATYNPQRTHDVTLFILAGERLALIRKPHFEEGIWRPPGGGIKPGEPFEQGVLREAREETGLEVELERYLVAAEARFFHGPHEVAWRTHVFLARALTDELEPQDTEEIAAARWGTLEELAGPLRERLLASGRAFWRYRVALHDAALHAIGDSTFSSSAGLEQSDEPPGL
jgi:ADP-ribose pyrophosphatase YjhB (NUDIX family)